MASRLLVPTPEHLNAYAEALRRGWSPDNLRGEAAARELLARMAADPGLFIERQTDPEAKGEAVELPDGSKVARLPGRTFWIWDDAEEGGFCGSLNLRWQKGTPALPPHCLGHIGYSVVPWRRNRGHASAALRAVLPIARDQAGLPYVEVTTDLDNLASRKVIERCGGIVFESFDKPAAFGGAPSLRYRIALQPDSPAP